MQTYTLRQLEYLVACVDHGSIAAAAEALNVSQPTISVAIAKLEAQFGVQLLLRHHSQGVSPTSSAENILQSVRSLLAQAGDIQRQAVQTGSAVAGELKLGSFNTLAPSVLPQLISALGHEYPDIHLRITEGTQEHLLEELGRGKLDVVLLYDIDLPDDVRRVPMAERSLYVALPEVHPLAAQPDVSLAELVDLPQILLDVQPSREYFLGLFREVGLEPRIAYSSPSLELVRGMVGQGLGYSVLGTRPYGDHTYDGRKLAIRPLRDVTRTSKIVLASLTALKPTRMMMSFEKVAAATIS